MTRMSSPKPANRRSQLAARREAEARTLLEKHQQDQLSFELLLAKKRKRKFRVASLVAVLAVGAGSGQILGPRLLNRQRNQQGPLPLLVIKDLPKQWELTFATSHLPAKVLNQTAVYQRFDSIDSIDSIKSSGSSTSPDSSDNSDNSDSSDSSASPKKKRTVLVSTFREDGRFGDSSLGTPRVDPNRLDSTGLLSQAEAIASDSFPVHSLANRPVRMQWKQPIVPFIMNQQATVVHIEARGMPSSDARDFGRSLKARRDLLRNGWATPDGFTEQIVIQQREALEGIQSSLIIKSNLDGKTRVMLQMRRATKPTVPIADLQDPPERLRLPSGREVKFTREFTHNYGWIESGYEITATVFRNDSEEGTGSVTAQQTTWFYNFVEPLPDRHLDGILDLLDRVRLGNDEQWRALTAGYQASLQQLPILGELKIGDLRIVIRTLPNTGDEKPGAIRLPHVLCAYSVCVPVYKNWDGLASEADLLIDDHWWHFRQIANYDKTIPKYFASPPVDNFKTGEAKLDRVYKWWGIDFGTKATAARNANEPRLLLRPLPR